MADWPVTGVALLRVWHTFTHTCHARNSWFEHVLTLSYQFKWSESGIYCTTTRGKKSMPCFCEEHGNNVGFSTFCNLRPVNVLLSRSTPHDDMCSCQTHENFISLTNALLPPYNRQWIVENSVCRFEEGCMLNQCATCKDGKQDSGDEVEVSRWQKATVDDRLK